MVFKSSQGRKLLNCSQCSASVIFFMDSDPTQKRIRIPDPDPDPGRILTKFKVSKFLSFFFGKKNFVDFLCLSKSALNTQILEHLEEI